MSRGSAIGPLTLCLTLAMGALVTVSGCATQTRPQTPQSPVIQATAEIPREELLDVGIDVLDPGLPAAGQPPPDDVFPELRRAEARFVAIQLKNTLQGTGQWGAVRVLPSDRGVSDLFITGTIVQSMGSTLELDLRAVDATGREWLQRRYRVAADELTYRTEDGPTSDPFQALYNEIANDLLKARQRLRVGQLRAIPQVARLRFAADLAPEPFADYLKSNNKGITSVRRLPAADDPMLARVDALRASENLFIDALDQHYAAFHETMSGPYGGWRKYTFEEDQAYRALRRKAMTQKILGGLAILGAVLADPGSQTAAVVRDVAVIGGMAAIYAGIATSSEAKIHAEAIRELAASVESELAPVVIEVEGRTLRLEGTAEAQYEEWRRLLREIWAAETGLPADLNRPGAAGAPPRPSATGDGSGSGR